MKTRVLFLIILCFGFSGNTKLNAQAISKTDSLALVDLYNSADGPHWARKTNWLTGPVKTWYGVTTADTAVTYLDLRSNALNGQIPPSIGNLAHLLSLRLEFNTLDTIPETIGNLKSVLWLGLADCHLKGKIPSGIGNLSSITNLMLMENQLTGPIPASIGKLLTLQELYLHANQLTGSIPSSIGNLGGLYVLYLNDNKLTGSLPGSIGKLTGLQGLYLYNNQLSGIIPSSIGKLIYLKYAYFNSNQFSGPIPSSLSRMKNINYLEMSNNHLSGGVPGNLQRLKQLGSFHLAFNNLSGDVSALASLKRTSDLSIGYNNFTFQGMETLVQANPYAVYSPQAPVSIMQSGNTLYVSAGGVLTYNKYQWFMVGDTASKIIKADSVFYPSREGTYYASITNRVADQLILTTDTINFVFPEQKMIATSKDNNSVVKQANIGLLFYPNPAKEIIHIRLNAANGFISILNTSGKVMLTKKIPGRDELDISSFSAGIYFIRNDQTGEVQKLIKVK